MSTAAAPTYGALDAIRRMRNVEILSCNAEAGAHPETVALAAEIGRLPQLFNADIIILLHAVSCAIQRHNRHFEHRQDLVSDIEAWQLQLDERIRDELAADADDELRSGGYW